MKLWIVGAALGTAIVAGAVLGATGVLDMSNEERLVALPGGEAAYSLCPDRETAGVFHGGDRVFVTGRDEGGGWVEVRAPEDLSARVWMRVEDLDPDAQLDVPIAHCAFAFRPTPTTAGTATTPGTGAPPTAGPPDTVTSTTSTPEFPTTTGDPSTTTTGVPTTPGPGDTTAPAITGLAVDQPRIWENAPSCSRLPDRASVVVTVDDASSGIAGVALNWSVGNTNGAAEMTGGGPTRNATIGPFAPGTVDAAGDAVLLTVTATDTAGNTATLEDFRLVRLEGCAS